MNFNQVPGATLFVQSKRFSERLWCIFNTLIRLKGRQWLFLIIRRGIKLPYSLPTTTFGKDANFGFLHDTHNSHCVHGNHFHFLNIPSQFPITDVQWRATSMSKLWRYNLHYFDYLRGTLDTQSKNILIHHWIEHNPYPCEDAWEPYPVSLRIINWIKYIHQSSESTPDSWRTSLYQQGHYLTRHIEWHIDANHFLKNIIALVLWSHFFTGSLALHWKKRSRKLLKELVLEQFNFDGGHYERSPMYHLILTYHLLDAYNAILMSTGVKPEWLHSTITNAIKYSQIIKKPDDTFPLIKDSANGIAPDLDEVIQYAAILGISISKVRENENACTSTYLQQSGYYIKKSSRDYLLVDVGNITPSHQPGHAHCDALHVELYLAGRSIFNDSGVFCYAASEQRDYSRSVRAHNTLGINGREQHELWGEFRIGNRGHTFNVQNDPNFCSAEFKPYWSTHKCNISHKRSIFTEDFSCIKIVDQVQGIGFADIESRWHLAPGLVPRLISSDIHISDIKNIYVVVIKLQHNQVISTITQSDLYSEFGLRESRYCITFTQVAAKLPWELSLEIQKVV